MSTKFAKNWGIACSKKIAERRQRLEAVIIAGLETQGNRVFSKQEICGFVHDAREEYRLSDRMCAVAVKTIMDWQGHRIAARAGK